MEPLARAETGESPPDWIELLRAEADMAPTAVPSYSIKRLFRANDGTVGNPVLTPPASVLFYNPIFLGGRDIADRLNH